ncbi:MAG: lysylphosphatidylglycerol synthase transmembrane domain-containing protein [Acidobacteriota bacterium]
MQGPSGAPWWKLVASLALAGALLVYFLSRVPMADVATTLARIHPLWLTAAIAASLGSYSLRALRWRVILKPLGSPRTSDLLGCTAAGFAASSVLPARAGEVIRPLLLSARTGLSAAGTMASVLTERLADLATILLMFGAAVPLARGDLASEALPMLRDAALFSGAGLVVFTAVVVLLLRRRERAVGLFVGVLPRRFRERAERFGHHVLDGLEAVRSPGSLAVLFLWSLAVWSLSVVQVTALARAFGLPLSVPASAVVMIVSGLGLAVPTPGGVGGFHAAIQFTLARLVGVDVATATGFALIHHAVCFVPITILGLAFVAVIGQSLGRLRGLPGENVSAER